MPPLVFSQNYAPACNPPESSETTISWSKCPNDPNAWYGITNEVYDFAAATQQCTSYGAELVSVTNQGRDLCASVTLNSNSVYEEMVLYAGKYFTPEFDYLIKKRLTTNFGPKKP